MVIMIPVWIVVGIWLVIRYGIGLERLILIVIGVFLLAVTVRFLVDVHGQVLNVGKSVMEYLDISVPGIIKFVLILIVFVFFMSFFSEFVYGRLMYDDRKRHDELKDKIDNLSDEISELSRKISRL